MNALTRALDRLDADNEYVTLRPAADVPGSYFVSVANVALPRRRVASMVISAEQLTTGRNGLADSIILLTDRMRTS